MKIDEHFRRLGFELYDAINGGKVDKHFTDFTAYFKDPVSGSLINEKRLIKLYRHVIETVPFYKQYYKDNSAENCFPVVEKTIIRKKYKLFVSSVYSNSNLRVATTSGSYGTPIKYLMTKEKYWRRFAEIIFFNRWTGYEIGMKHVLTRIIPKTKIKRFLENEIIIYPANIDESWLKDKCRMLERHKPSFLISYPSILSTLANYILLSREQCELNYIKGIIAISEPLLEDDRKIIEGVFGCPVLGRYSCEEFGVLAHECLAERRYHLNTASYKIELLDLNRDEPVKQGEPGRVIVTDFFSHAMPLIRYDTGDLAVIGKDCPCGLRTPVLERIEGRQAELIYDTAGRMVSPLALVTPIARTLEGILQFQFIQTGKKDYCLKMVTMPSYPYEKAGLIKEKLLKTLGKEAEIDFNYVDNIAPLPSGKRPYIINNYKKNI
jgi:phenylacetate-CoA ligase